MHPLGTQVERISRTPTAHTIAPQAPPASVSIDGPTAVAVAAAFAVPRVVRLGVAPPELAATSLTQTLSPRDAGALESTSPTLQSLSPSASLAAPPTPSSWMVRGPSLDAFTGGTSSIPALPHATAHDGSTAAASSFNSPVSHATLSPLLRPHVGLGDGEGVEGGRHPMERASGRKRTPRSAALSTTLGNGPAAATGDGAGESGSGTPCSTRLVFSRRTSVAGSISEQGEELHPRCAADSALDEDAHHASGESLQLEVQSTLHSSRSRTSAGTATAVTTTRTASPMQQSLPAVSLGTTIIAAQMSDVPATARSTDSSPSPRSASAVARSAAAAAETTKVAPTSPQKAAAASSSACAPAVSGGPPHAASLPPPLPMSRGVSVAHSPLRSEALAGGDDNEAGGSSDYDVVSHQRARNPACTPFASPSPPSAQSPVASAAAVAAQPQPAAISPTHFSGMLRGAFGASSGRELTSPCVLASTHFGSSGALQSWPQRSRASQSSSFADLGSVSDVEADKDDDDDDDNNNNGDEAAAERSFANDRTGAPSRDGCRSRRTSTAPMLHRVSGEAAATAAVRVSASVTAYPGDHVNSAVETHGLPPRSPGPASGPLMDAWTAAPLTGVSRDESAHTSRSSSTNSRHMSLRHFGVDVRGHSATTSVLGTPNTVPVPVLSSTETQQQQQAGSPAHGTTAARATSPAFPHHAPFSRSLFGRFGTSPASSTPPDGAGLRGHSPSSGTAPQLPPPPPPTSRVPSPILRAAAAISSGFASAALHVAPAADLASSDSSPQRHTGSSASSRGGVDGGGSCRSSARNFAHDGPRSDAYSPPVSGRGSVQVVPSVCVTDSRRSTPEESGGVVGAMPAMALPPAECDASACTTPGAAAAGRGAHTSPCTKARPSASPTGLSATQARDLLCTPNSSLRASTPHTLTSAVSDPMLLSLCSANLAAPLASNGSTITNISTFCSPTAASVSGTTAQATPSDGFVMRPDAETVLGLPRGKVPRMPGCSMRDWTAHLAAKEAELRRHAGSRAALPRLTPQEVARHNTPDDLWMVIRNVVYNCTEFQRFHPGGEKLLMACAGRDATEVYDKFHAWVSCESFMGPYAVGVLAPSH